MARPVLLGCRSVAKTYGDRALFEDLTFSIHEGDHVGLVGPNGAGKSTLLRILAGLEAPDTGECYRRSGLRIGYVPQRPVFAPGGTARDAVEDALASVPHLDEHERETRAAIALGKGGFDDPAVATDTLSGGWKTRLAIVRALALEPDLLVLDEPTNHLDLESIVDLEATLRAETRAFAVVSHDRAFLEGVAGRMLDIDRVYAGGLLAVDGGYADLLDARAATLEAQSSQEQALANRVRRELSWLRRGPKARTSKSRARIEAAGRGIEELREVRDRAAEDPVGIDLAGSGRRTKRLWACKGLKKRFGDTKIVEGLDLLLTPGTRIGLLGANGAGKTTLLEMIVGRLEPDAGEIQRADGLRVVYFDQSRESVDPDLTLGRALAPEGEQVVVGAQQFHVVAWARRFRFRREQLETPVGRLSGGERARVVIARMMLRPADLLVLDEPTNDLDISTLEVLEDSLLEFPGALVLVTHDRRLLDRVSTTILALDGRGGVERFAESSQWAAAARRATAADKPRPAGSPRRAPRSRQRKLSYREQQEFDGMEAVILEAEGRFERARSAAEDPSIATDAGALEARLAALEGIRGEVARLYARWAELEAKMSENEAAAD